jgi:hypothetical protein
MTFCIPCTPYNEFLSEYNNEADVNKSQQILITQSKCIQEQLKCVTKNINSSLENENKGNDQIITALQLNNDSMTMYTTDYFYVIIKGILYFIILGLFIYFYGIYNLLENIKTTAVTVKDTAIKVKDSIKNKVAMKD